MDDRIHAAVADIGVGLEVKRGVKARTRIAAFPCAMDHVMDQRVRTGSANVVVALQIPARVENRIWAIALEIAAFEIRSDWRQSAFGCVFVLVVVPFGVKEAAARELAL